MKVKLLSNELDEISLSIQKKTIKPQLAPKFTKSQRESSSQPNLVAHCRARAACPSSPSNTADIKRNITANL